jgi:hypothetical protein
MTSTVARARAAEAPGSPEPLIVVRVVRARLFRTRDGRRMTLTTTQPEAVPVASTTRPLRVAGMIALAFEVERMIDGGELRDRAEAARALGFSRARVTQLLDLTLLAPDIVEAVVFMEHAKGVERVTVSPPVPVRGDLTN